jgi:ribose 5-phosphate isomerase B
VEDCGALTLDPEDDAMDFAKAAVEKIKEGDKGILFCGSGVMMDIVANRFKHIRACMAITREQVQQGRNDDDANVLVISTDTFSGEDTQALVDIFLSTPFSGEEKYTKRLEKLQSL